MAKALLAVTLIIVIQVVQSYILLTANIDDLRNIGRRVAHSPITGQVSKIVRRAYNVFNSNLGKSRGNTRGDDDDIVLAYQPEESTSYRRRRGDGSGPSSEESEHPETFSALGKSASVYLKKIKKIFENA